MNWEDLAKSYVRKINETWGNTTEDLETEIVPRLGEVYWEICRDTGCTWVKPTTLTLSGVTASTNKHRLYTALGLTSGEVFSLHRVWWEGVPLAEWSRGSIDAEIDYAQSTVSGDPVAFSFSTEYDSTDNDERSYVSFYPFVGDANTTDCKATYYWRPAKPAYATLDSTYPAFSSIYHEILSEKAAVQRLMEAGDAKLSNLRLARLDTELRKMRNHYLSMMESAIEGSSLFGAPQGLTNLRFYGE